MTTLILKRPLVNQLLRHAQHQPEQEVCCLIVNRGDAMHFYPVANISDTPQCLYEMNTAQQSGTLRLMRERGEALFANYHSHPHSPPAPSFIDLEQAAYPDTLYIIASLESKGVLELRGYRLRDGTVEELTLEISGCPCVAADADYRLHEGGLCSESPIEFCFFCFLF